MAVHCTLYVRHSLDTARDFEVLERVRARPAHEHGFIGRGTAELLIFNKGGPFDAHICYFMQ